MKDPVSLPFGRLHASQKGERRVPTACLYKGGCTELTDIYRQETTAFTEEPRAQFPGNGYICAVCLGYHMQEKGKTEILSEHSALIPNRRVSVFVTSLIPCNGQPYRETIVSVAPCSSLMEP